jgi:mRNA interferase RelE/StbE
LKFQVIVHRSVYKSLLKYDSSLVRRIRDAIAGLSVDPRPSGSKKLIGLNDCFRIRVGKYRILYAVSNEEMKVTVYRVAHRKETYR